MVSLFQSNHRWLRRAAVIGLWSVFATCATMSCTAAEVEAQIDRESVPAGEGALMTIRITGGSAEPPQIPEVGNLIVEPRGSSKQMQVFNGRTTVTVTYNYAVGSNTPGDYQIPSFEVTVDGGKFQTRELKLKVLDSGAANPPAGIPPNPPAGQPSETDEEDAAGRRFGFLTVEPADSDRKHVYVGEIAPVRIRAWLPEDSRASLRSGIQPEGKAFTLHHVSKQPQQTREIRDGKRYLVVTWFGGISATKAGKYPASLSLNATVAVRDTTARQQPRRRTGGPFDDPFFDRVFEDMNVPMIQKDVTLKSDDQEIEVWPLPKDGRPAGFSGAIGNFKIDAWEIPTQWKTGEPQQVQARIAGSGNFALMNAPDLTPRDAWKAYPGRDEFTPGDEASFSGNKVFQFSAVPRKGGPMNVALEFSFFDPATGEYKTLRSPEKSIQISGEDIPSDQATGISATKEPDKKEDDLVGQHSGWSPRRSLIPLVSLPAFSQWLAGSGGCVLFGGCLAWFRVRRENPQRIARAAIEKATREALHSANQCAEARDVGGFFAAARLALQQRLGEIWNQPAPAITLAEIDARMPGDSSVAWFFREADRLAYYPSSSCEDLPQWRIRLDEAMASLTSINR